MTCCNPLRVDSVRLFEEVTKLRKGVAAHARNWRATARIFADEVVDHIVSESALEIQHVVRDPELLADPSSVVYGVQRAAGPVGDILAVAEKFHGRANDIVALLDQERGGDG